MPAQSTTFQAIGTAWNISVDELDDSLWAKLLARIRRRIADFDKTYSRFRSDSVVMHISQKAGTYALPADAFELLQYYERLYWATEGKVTPLIGNTMVEAGYDAEYSLQPKELHTPPKWENTLSYDDTQIVTTRPVLLDVGAAGKGYLVDIVAELFEAAGVVGFLINAGGDICHHTHDGRSIEVGLENPFDTSEVIGVARVASKSLCASAGSKRAWGEFHHIIDPTTLQSPEEVIATWVVADDTMTADGIATALFLQSAGPLMDQFSFSYAVLYRDLSLLRSKDFPVTVFEAKT